MDIYEAKVACLSSFVQLENICDKECLKLSDRTNRFMLASALKKLGALTSQKIIKKCKFAFHYPYPCSFITMQLTFDLEHSYCS